MKKRQLVLKSSGGGGGEGDDHAASHSSANSLRTVRYAECQKNHAANVGGYAVDGCREFMPCGQAGTSGALTCAACGCHRNYHRREVDGEASTCDCNM